MIINVNVPTIHSYLPMPFLQNLRSTTFNILDTSDLFLHRFSPFSHFDDYRNG